MTKHQAELFSAETTWFHVFKDMIDNGDMARLDGSAIKVYLVVKSFTNFSTGRAFPAIELISEKSGLSDSQVMRCLKSLEEAGYISKSKSGRHNIYTLREKVTIKDDTGRPQAVATWDYIPNSVRDAVADLKHVMVSGDLGGAKIVNIENLTVNMNIIHGDNSTQVNFNQEAFNKLPKEMQDSLMSIKPKPKG
jgi:DNA-binding transcriptional ArsR family regulator